MKKPEPLNFDEGVILFIITYELLALSTLNADDHPTWYEIEIHYTPRYQSNPSAPPEPRLILAPVTECPEHGATEIDFPRAATENEGHPAWFEIDRIYTAVESVAPGYTDRGTLANLIAKYGAIDSPSRLFILAGDLFAEAEWLRTFRPEPKCANREAALRIAADAAAEVAAYLEDFPNRDDADNPAA